MKQLRRLLSRLCAEGHHLACTGHRAGLPPYPWRSCHCPCHGAHPRPAVS